jgi:itaconate CoA-transferase
MMRGPSRPKIVVGRREPLADVRVIALEQSVAGPLASRILADMGADVIKVEPPNGDFSRHWDAQVKGFGSYFVWLNRRKRSIALTLRDPEDLVTFHRLLKSADVLVFNMSTASAERARLTPDRLRADYPTLIACQITGYGRTGATRDRKAYDMLLQAETGLLSMTGDAQGPVRIGVSLADVGTGLYASTLILAALYERTSSRVGRFIDLSMFEAMTEFVGPNLTAFANAGTRYPRSRLRHHNIVPYGVFQCSDGYIAIAIEQDAEWRSLCERVLARPDLAARQDLATNVQRVAFRAQVESEVEAEMARMPRQELQLRLDAAALAYGIINDIDQVWNHPVERDLNLHALAELPDGTIVSVPRSPAERVFGKAETTPIPDLDQHRAQILSDLSRELVI